MLSIFPLVTSLQNMQLWMRHSAQLMKSCPNEISRHLFEIYGHFVFSVGGRTLKCRCLDSGSVTEITLDALRSQKITFVKHTIPTAEELPGKYYEHDTFPAIDSLTSQGMFQFTVVAEHPIRGVQILQRLCKMYVEPSSSLLFLHIGLQPLRNRFQRKNGHR